MNKIILTADSTFDMTQDMSAKLGIEVIPSYVRLDGDNIFDYPDITMYDLFGFHDRTGKLPQTAAASPWDYTQFFQKYASAESQVIHIAKSSKMSSCYDNAVNAAENFENVFVFDSLSVGGGSAMLAIIASKLREKGFSATEIISKLEATRGKIFGSFIVDQLDYLHKGGRCSALALMGANMLKLRPEIVVRDGQMLLGRKYRGKYESCMFEFMDDRLSEMSGIDPEYLFISHTVTDPALLDKAIQHIKAKKHFENITVLEAGAAVSCHCGPNTFGMFYLSIK